MRRYEEAFKTDGWCKEWGVPSHLAQELPSLIRIIPQKTFFWLTFTDIDAIFVDRTDVPAELLTLHLWDSYSLHHLTA